MTAPVEQGNPVAEIVRQRFSQKTPERERLRRRQVLKREFLESAQQSLAIAPDPEYTQSHPGYIATRPIRIETPDITVDVRISQYSHETEGDFANKEVRTQIFSTKVGDEDKREYPLFRVESYKSKSTYNGHVSNSGTGMILNEELRTASDAELERGVHAMHYLQHKLEEIQSPNIKA